MATGPIHFDASYIRHLIDDLRAQAGMDESELLRRLTSELSWIAGGSILTEARLQDVILETARGFFTVSQIPSEGAADLYRFRLALLDRLAARMEVESEVLRRCQEGLAHLEFTLRPVTPAAATLAGGVKNAAQRFRAMQAPAEPPSPIGAMIAEELARPQREDVGSLTVLSLAWPSPPVIPFSTPHIWQFFFRPDSPPDEVSIELDRRLIDGMAAAEIVRQAQSLDWSQNFFPLWYALNRGLDAANQEMRTRFEVALRDLNHFFVRQQGKTPDKVYNWKKTRSHFAALSPEKVGNAFLSFRPDLENQVHALPPLAQGPQAPAHVSTQASLDPEVESRIRQEVERCGKIWGSVPGRTQNAADRAAELAKGLPGNSRGATTSLAATFVYEMLQILFDLGRDRVAGDQELSRFNRQLAESAAAIMDAVAWEPHIDEKSLQQIADASVAAKRNGRNLIATSTHESWVDITAIASLFQDRGVRFTYKSELLWVPLLNLILKGSNMALMDRVKPTGNPDKDGMARVRAIGQVDHVREMRMIDHALNVAFTPGTRSRVGGVGPAKKGDANQAIDNDSLILVMTLFGTGQIKPTSWSKLLAKGLGINRQVHLRTAVIDPRDFPAPAGITNPTLARAARVQAITDKIFETQVDQHLEIIAGLIAAASSPAEEPNAERIQLDEFLTPYADAFVYLERGEEEKFEKWCVKNKVAPAYVGALLESLPEEEVLALYERTGKKPTSEAMREHRVGPWAIANIKRRIKERLFTSRKPAPIERPQITYHDEPSARMTFGDYRTAYTEAHQDDAERVAELIRSQVSIQGSRFQEELAEIFLPELHKASAPYGEAVQRYIDAYESAEHPSYAPVSEATLALHREIMASPDLFPGLDPDLKIWALYTLEVGERFMLSELLGTPDPVLKARYYRLLGRGIRYRILNRVNEIIGGDPENRTFQDTARALWHRSEISELTDRAEMAELACELIASNRSLADELAEVKKALVEKEGELGWLGKWKPVSYRATVYNKLKERERLLEKLSGLGAGKSLDRLLGIAAGDFWLYRGVSWDAVMKDKELQAAWAEKNRAEEKWAHDYEADFKKWAPMEADVYRKSFEAEAKTHAVERDMQKARYIDFISEMQDDMRGPSLKALAEYAKIFDHYLEQARDIGRPDSKTKEHQRKVTECDLFFAWLKLHWAVTDALKKTGDPRAGKIKLFSAMFTNQVELLNQFSSDQLEGLRPIVESMTFEQVSDLYFEALLAGNDPRVLDRVMGRWGLHATSIATNEVKVYGAGVLAGTLGQSSGAHLFGHGASILQEDQIGFGAVPQMMGFSPNHQGFSDYTFVVAFLASLGLGRPWVVYEAKNFDPLPVWGRVLGGGDGIGFERDKGGSNVLGQRMVASADRGISPVGFDWGTRRFTTAPNPFAEGPLASFLPREMILGGSIAEIGHAARTSHIPFVPVYQNAGSHNVEPDIGLTGNLYDKNFRRPWSIHGGAVLRTGPAVLAFGDPVPGWVMPGGAEDLARMGLTGIPALSGTNRDARYLTAAHTEVGRLHAFKRTLRPSGGQGGLTQGSGQITAASSKPAPQGTHAKPKAGARGGILGRWSPRGAPRSAVPARVAAPH